MDKYTNSFIKENVINYIFRGCSFLFSFISVRLSIEFLGDELYGIWLTVITVINWMNLSDFGLGNGLRNQLTESIAQKNYYESKSLILTAGIILSKISLVIMLVGLLGIFFLFKVTIIDTALLLPLFISLFGFCINFVLGIGRSIGYSLQKSFYVVATQCIADGILLFELAIVKNIFSPSLVVYAIISVLNLFVANIGLLFFLKIKYPYLFCFEKKLYNSQKIFQIARLGIQFFVLQITSMLLFTTDNLIIQFISGGSAVTYYNVINKLYTGGNDLFSIVLISTWSAVTYAKTLNNVRYIEEIRKKLLFLWGGFSIGVIMISPFVNGIITIWIGKNAELYSFESIIVFAVHCILLAWNGIWTNIDNGFGELKIQLIGSVLGAIINIPLSIFLMERVGLGINGVKIGTIVSLLFTAIPLPIQINKKISEMKSHKV